MKKFIICAICAICGFTTANAQGKIGHVDTQSIIQAMPEYSKAESEIKALQSQYEADLKSMQDELQKKSEAFDKEQASLPDNIKQRRQQELQEMYQKIQQSYQDNNQALQKFVLINEINAGIPYINTTLSTDVTAQVKAKLGLK